MTALAPFKRAVAWSLLRSGALSVHRSRFEKGRAILLAYHRINDAGDPFFPALPRSVFAAQLDYLAAHYRVEPLDDVVAWLAAGAEGAPRAAFTIDDGYPDTVEVALPELERRGLPATVFVATGPPETGEPLWTDRTRWMVKYATVARLDASGLGLPGGSLARAADRLDLLKRLLRCLKAMGPADIDRGLRALEAALAPQGPPLRLLGWEQVRRLAARAITLGAHTHRHYMLSRLDEPGQEGEIAASVRLIEERTGRRPTGFAYPNGESADYDERSIAALRRLGLRYAVTCRHALARARPDPFQLPRLYTSEPSISLFAARLAGLGEEELVEMQVS